MPPVNIPIAQVWENGLTNSEGIFWITANPAGINDPQPINTSLGVTFNSGTQEELNTFTVYLRGSSNTPVLEGQLNNQTLGTLNGFTLANNQNLPPSIEVAESPYAFNIQVTLQWGNYNGTLGYQLSLQNSINSTIYQYNTLVSSSILGTTSLTNNTQYLLYIKLNNNTINVIIYPYNTYGYLGSPIFTSAPILDSSVFYRTPGNIGINVNCVDSGAKVLSLYPYHTVFAVFESYTFNSLTPVIGAQLYTQNTPPTQLFDGVFVGLPSSDSITPFITTDSGRTLSGQSIKVIFGESNANQTYQSIISDQLTPLGDTISGITDFNTLNASFDIWIESSALNKSSTPFVCTLFNENYYGLALELPTIIPNQWNHIVLHLNPEIITSANSILTNPVSVNSLVPSGLYQFCILYTGNTATSIWLDNIQITSDAINWYGRATSNNPFIKELASWIPFNNTINTTNSGIRFDKPGYALQVKAEALQQDTEVYNGYTLVPNYAQLGRVVLDDVDPTVINSDLITISATSLGSHEWKFTCNITSNSGSIYNIIWSFGDGNYAFDQWFTGTPNVTRVYQYQPAPTTFGSYFVNVSVIDNNGNKGYGTPSGTIS